MSFLQHTQEKLGFFDIFSSTCWGRQCIPRAPSMAVRGTGRRLWAQRGRVPQKTGKNSETKGLTSIDAKKQDRHT